MDRRLFETALTGNVSFLFQLLKEDPLMLHTVALKSGNTPLHVAFVADHLNLVKELIRLKPEFAGEMNPDGFSPMHLASANGYLEIVKELLKIDHNHCRLKSKDGRTPLHFAVAKGKICVINELLSSCPESVEDVTFGGETALHLALMNNQFEAFKVMVERLKQLNKEDMLNWKDELGNTVLHIATSTKQREVIELLLCKDNVTNGAVEVNAINGYNLTALDIKQMFPSEVGGRQIKEILLRAGAKRAQEVLSATPATTNQVLLDDSRNSACSQSPLGRLVEYFRFQIGRDSPSDARTVLLLIAVLIATATYQAGLSPPGNVWQDNSDSSNKNDTKKTKSHTAGKSILGTNDRIAFGIFLFSNSTGFYMALFIIDILTRGFPLRIELQICILVMVFTYNIYMENLSAGGLTISFHAFSLFCPLAIPIILTWVRLLLDKRRRARAIPVSDHEAQPNQC